jgi:DNA invertase Pin-like site-specific DNA recombinase
MDAIISQIYCPKPYTRPMVTAVVLVAVYVRISFDRHGKRYGVSDQVKDVIALIEGTPGLAVGEVYEDNDVSAFDKEVERPSYNRLVADIRAGKYTAVACVRGSRLVRQRRQRAEFIDLMESVAGRVYTTDGTVYDFTSEVGRGQFDSDGAKDTSESEKISVRTTRAHLRLAEQGRYPGGRRPYGLDRHLEIIDGEVVVSYRVNEAEAEILREAARRVLAGDSTHSIVADFNRRGVPTAQGGKWWDPHTLKPMLLRPGVAGLRSHKSHDNIVGEAEWDAIIPVEEWMAVKEVLEKRAETGRKFAGDVVNLLAGFVVCATCGNKMRNASSGSRPRTYRCVAPAGRCARKMSIDAVKVENLIDALMAAKLAEYAAYTAVEAPSRAAAKIAELTARLDGLAEKWAKGRLSDSAYDKAYRAAEKELEDFRRQAEQEARTRVVLPGAHAAEAWKSGTLNERRALLETLVERIEIRPETRAGKFGNTFDPDRVHVVWRTLKGTATAGP